MNGGHGDAGQKGQKDTRAETDEQTLRNEPFERERDA